MGMEMLISELEAELKTLREQHGDLPIVQYGHSNMVTIKDPKINVIEMTAKIAERVVWDTQQNIKLGEMFAWL